MQADQTPPPEEPSSPEPTNHLAMETLSEVILTLTARISREAVLDEILRQARRLVPFTAANIVLLEGDTLRLARWQGYQDVDDEEAFAALKQSLVDFPLDAEVVETRRPLFVADTWQDDRWIPTLHSAWIRSFIALPLCFGERVLGLLRLDSHEPGKFSADHIRLLRPLANAAAIALENARLYNQIRQELAERKEAELEVLELNRRLFAVQYAAATIASSLDLPYVLRVLADEMTNLLNVEGCFVFDWRAGKDTLTLLTAHLPTGRSDAPSTLSLADFPLAHRALKEPSPRQVVFNSPDLQPSERAYMEKWHLKTILTVPMVFREQAAGLILAVDGQRERTFSLEEVALAQLLANQAASAIQNARLYRKAQQEIEERKRIEEKLRKLSRAVEQSPVIVIITDPDGKIEYVNPKFTQVTGYTPEEAIGQTPRILKSGEMPPALYKHLWETITSGKAWQGELHNRKKSGELYWGMASISPIRDAEGRITHFVAVQEDITERKEAQNALAQSEARLFAEMQSVLSITRALVREINLDNLLAFIMSQAEHLTNANGALILSWNEERQQLEVTLGHKTPPALEVGTPFPHHHSLISEALASGSVQMTNRAQEDERATPLLHLLQLEGVASLLCAPLTTPKEWLGTLLLWRRQAEGFSVADRRLLGLFADQEALAIQNARLHARNRRLAIEQERHRLARELHDTVTQSLYSIAMAANTALRLLPPSASSERLREPLVHINTLAKQALTEMREQIYLLASTTLAEKGLVAALTEHCHSLTQRYGLAIHFTGDPDLSLLPEQEQALYYAAREALWNVVRHAAATRVDISITRQQNCILFSLTDNGMGFDPSLVEQEGMTGLRSMKERAAQVGGSFEIRATPGRGTTVIIRLPQQAMMAQT